MQPQRYTTQMKAHIAYVRTLPPVIATEETIRQVVAESRTGSVFIVYEALTPCTVWFDIDYDLKPEEYPISDENLREMLVAFQGRWTEHLGREYRMSVAICQDIRQKSTGPHAKLSLRIVYPELITTSNNLNRWSEIHPLLFQFGQVEADRSKYHKRSTNRNINLMRMVETYKCTVEGARTTEGYQRIQTGNYLDFWFTQIPEGSIELGDPVKIVEAIPLQQMPQIVQASPIAVQAVEHQQLIDEIHYEDTDHSYNSIKSHGLYNDDQSHESLLELINLISISYFDEYATCLNYIWLCHGVFEGVIGLKYAHYGCKKSIKYDSNWVTTIYNSYDTQRHTINTLYMLYRWAKTSNAEGYYRWRHQNTQESLRLLEEITTYASPPIYARMYKKLSTSALLISDQDMYINTGTIWENRPDKIHEDILFTLETYITSHINSCQDENQVKNWKKALLYVYRNVKFIYDSIVQSIEFRPRINPDMLNNYSYYICFTDCIYDISNRRILSIQDIENNSIYATKSVGYSYHDVMTIDKTSDDYQRYRRFIQEIYPDEDERNYVMKVFSKCLDGGNRQQTCYFMCGEGANGKSLMLNLYKQTIGEYHGTIFKENLYMPISPNSASPILCSVIDARLIQINELDARTPLKEDLIKLFDGQTMIPIRQLYGKPISKVFGGVLMILSNYRPIFSSISAGLTRRIRLIMHRSRFEYVADEANYIFKREPDIDTNFNRWRIYFMNDLLELYNMDWFDPLNEVPARFQEELRTIIYNEDELECFVNEMIDITNNNTDLLKIKDIVQNNLYEHWLQQTDRLGKYENSSTFMNAFRLKFILRFHSRIKLQGIDYRNVIRGMRWKDIEG